MKSAVQSAVKLTLIGFLSLCLPLQAENPTREQYSVSTSPIRDVKAADGSPNREFTVEVKKDGKAAHHFVVSAPYKAFNSQEEPYTFIVGDRLLVYTLRVIAVFDLQEGRQVFDGSGMPDIVATKDGHRVAYRENQLPFTSPEATTTVIQALDVTTLEHGPVFPEKSLIERTQNGLLEVWEEDPLKRHNVFKLLWAPDGSRLAFFCSHESGQMYLVIIDLRQGIAKSRFVHRPFDWKPYLKKGVDLKGREPSFAFDSITWSADDTLVVTPQPFAYWLQNPMVIPLADLEKELEKGE